MDLVNMDLSLLIELKNRLDQNVKNSTESKQPQIADKDAPLVQQDSNNKGSQ